MEMSSEKQQRSLEEKLQVLLEKLENLEARIASLERPTIAYKRPKASEYETLSETLDYLHNNVEGIKKDLLQVARTV